MFYETSKNVKLQTLIYLACTRIIRTLAINMHQNNKKKYLFLLKIVERKQSKGVRIEKKD